MPTLEEKIVAKTNELEELKGALSSKDKNINKVLQEYKQTEDETYKKVLESYIQKHINMSKTSSEMTQTQMENLETLEGSLKKIKESEKELRKESAVIRRKEQALDPTAFMSEFGASFRETKSEGEGLLSSLGAGISGAGSQLKESFKSLTSFKNLSKGVLHGAGLATNMPALNILASEISGDDSTAKEQEAKMKLADTLSTSGSTIDVGGPTSTAKEQESMDAQDDTQLFLENIEENTFETNRLLKDYLFMQKDMADDVKKGLSGPTSALDEFGTAATVGAGEELNMLDDLSMLGDIGGAAGAGVAGGAAANAGKLKNLAKRTASVAKGLFGKLALPLTVALAAYDAFKGIEKAGEVYGLKEGQEATFAQKAASAFGEVLETISFGLIENTKSTGESIMEFMKNWTPIGIISSKLSDLMTDDDAEAMVDKLEKSGAVDTSIIGSSEIRDWGAIEKLSPSEIDAVLKYNDWSDEDVKRLKQIKKSKQSTEQPKAKMEPISATESSGSNSYSGINWDTMPKGDINDTSSIDTPSKKVEETKTQQSAPVVVQGGSGNNATKTKKIDSFRLEDDNLLTAMKQSGLSAL